MYLLFSVSLVQSCSESVLMILMICTFRTFADDTKLGEVADMLDGYIGIQKGVNKLEKWADRNLMKFNNKCKILHLVGEGNNLRNHILLGRELERRFAEKIFWEVDNKLNRSQHCALAIKKAHDI